VSRAVTHDGSSGFHVRFPFDRRLVNLVKGLTGRRWNPTEKYWWVPEDQVVALVELLQPEGFTIDEATAFAYRERGGTLSIEPARPRPATTAQRDLFSSLDSVDGEAPDPSPKSDDYTVGRLNSEVKATLERAFPAPIWLVGEISGYNKNARRRHVTFHMVEREEDGRALAEVNATLFESVRRQIEAKLASAGDPFRLEDEVTVRLRVRVELYVPWGSYRVLVDDLDIHYTLGEAARRREEIIRRLTEQGLLERNTSLTFPELPLRVGLVTSLNSDAYNDVVRTLEESGFAFRLTAHGARVQGRQTEPSVLNALDWFYHRKDRFDVLLVCRGGGSRTDLAWFDSEALGKAVATFPIPVVVGIGHEQDHSVLDAVGWRCKTPTAAAGFVVDRVTQFLDRVDETGRAVIELAARRLEEENRIARERARRLAMAARNLLERHGADLRHRRIRTMSGARAILAAARGELAHRALAVPRVAMIRVGQERAILDRAARQVSQGARRDLSGAHRKILDLAMTLGPRSSRWLALERERTETRRRRLEVADPKQVVARGFAILRLSGGELVTDARRAPRGVPLRAELKRGALLLRSEGPEEPGRS
jgi:exodeoxyribonuclease VII large subunit